MNAVNDKQRNIQLMCECISILLEVDNSLYAQMKDEIKLQAAGNNWLVQYFDKLFQVTDGYRKKGLQYGK